MPKLRLGLGSNDVIIANCMGAAVKGAFDRRKSLQELEKCDWGEASYSSYLVGTCHQLRRKPLVEFTVEDLRIMIGQQISLPILVPLAVEALEINPLAEGDFYAGDLLSAVLKIQNTFWIDHPDSSQRMRVVVRNLREMMPSIAEADRSTVERLLQESAQSLLLQ